MICLWCTFLTVHELTNKITFSPVEYENTARSILPLFLRSLDFFLATSEDFARSSFSVFKSHFPGEPELAGFIGAKNDETLHVLYLQLSPLRWQLEI